MGGQACVLYGGAEFSRDTDILIAASEASLEDLGRALSALKANRIAVPELSRDVLARGHAVHFRCRRPDVEGMRLDVMASLRGMDSFDALWERRTTMEFADGGRIDLLSLPDLVAAKKTQRDKDWPMVRRLIEADYAIPRGEPGMERIRFWLRESRTAAMLIEVAREHPEAARAMTGTRPLLELALRGEEAALEEALRAEEAAERNLDREYWRPLKSELEKLRHQTARANRGEGT